MTTMTKMVNIIVTFVLFIFYSMYYIYVDKFELRIGVYTRILKKLISSNILFF